MLQYIPEDLADDEQEIELIDIDKDEEDEESHPIDTRNRKLRPKAAKGERSITPNLPSFVMELDNDVEKLLTGQSTSESMMSTRVRPKAAKGVRTPMKCQTMKTADRIINDTALPGEVVPSYGYILKKKPVLSRPQLTVPAIRTAEQKYLDSWMQRQIHAEHASDSE